MKDAVSSKTSTIIGKLTLLGSTLNGVIDSGDAIDVSVDNVYDHIEEGTIFSFLNARFEFVAGWGLASWSPEEKRALLGEWQSMANAIDPERKFGVSRNGLSLLLAYVLEGIQMRLYGGDAPWPCPEPDRDPQ